MDTIKLQNVMEKEMSEREISRRNQLLRLDRQELNLLKSCRGFIEADVDAIVDEFYDIQISFPEIADKIGEPETFRRLHLAQRQYILDLFAGETTVDYVNNRLQIGLVHHRIGVEPKLYLAAMKLLKDLIVKSLQRHLGHPAPFEAVCTALDKLLHFDLALVFDTYIGGLVAEVESAKDRVEAYARTLEQQVEARTRELHEKVAQLEAAMATVKKLEGVIPICASCKKIRNDEQSWQQMEQYISEHSEAMFSHGLCPDCYEKEMSAIRNMKSPGPGAASGK
ncbi:protoglobin domain-containing protein [Geomesophilobacter sediminis]|uniref:Globin-sensor domain-containing protein n=1 Tax=Geomesophilobacter sediminis TaxID=2798584 RepID=A0A8J7IML2_9BACT|nr:protoglobin domain-containing protein [Geomesophilobacter sediminis]MBJ6724023.1 hypothetical protein [Geomesophilobacter sediminis]